MRPTYHRAYTCTTLQLPQRLLFKEAKTAWIALTSALKINYSLLANALHPPITGYNYFLRLYLTGQIQPTPPPAAFQSLLHFDGEQDSTTFTDESGKIWTAQGSARLDRSTSRFGSASGLFEYGGLNFITTPFTEDWDSGVGPFTLEMFANINSIIDGSTLFILLSDSGAFFIIYIYNTGIIAYFGSEEFNIYAAGGDVELHPGFWDHFAVERDGVSLSLFLNGTLVGTPIDIAADHMPLPGTTPVSIGAGLNQYDGHLDEFRFILEAVPPSTFPPTHPY